jgi:hypothetical protein
MSNSFIGYNPYANPYVDNNSLQGISYPNFVVTQVLKNNAAPVSIPRIMKDRTSDTTTLEYDRLQQYIEKEINKGQKDLLVA